VDTLQDGGSKTSPLLVCLCFGRMEFLISIECFLPALSPDTYPPTIETLRCRRLRVDFQEVLQPIVRFNDLSCRKIPGKIDAGRKRVDCTGQAPCCRESAPVGDCPNTKLADSPVVGCATSARVLER